MEDGARRQLQKRRVDFVAEPHKRTRTGPDRDLIPGVRLLGGELFLLLAEPGDLALKDFEGAKDKLVFGQLALGDLLLARHVGAILADRGKDVMAHPAIEGAGGGLVAPADELVQTRLGDEGYSVRATDAVLKTHPMGLSVGQYALLVGVQFTDCVVGSNGTVIPHVDQERATHFGRDEPRLTVDLHGADGVYGAREYAKLNALVEPKSDLASSPSAAATLPERTQPFPPARIPDSAPFPNPSPSLCPKIPQGNGGSNWNCRAGRFLLFVASQYGRTRIAAGPSSSSSF